jgi:hypothetical protein
VLHAKKGGGVGGGDGGLVRGGYQGWTGRRERGERNGSEEGTVSIVSLYGCFHLMQPISGIDQGMSRERQKESERDKWRVKEERDEIRERERESGERQRERKRERKRDRERKRCRSSK